MLQAKAWSLSPIPKKLWKAMMTKGPVPVLLQNGRGASLVDGRLADIAPTLLELMGLPKPPEMTGTSLLR